MKHLRIPPLMATAAVALSLVLGGCGGGSDNEEMMPEPEPMPPMPVSTGQMALELSGLAQDRLEAVPGLNEAGDSSTVTIPAGETVTRAAVPGVHGGVDFSCDSMYDCTVTITNSAGTITATWESMMLPGGDAPMVMASAFAPTDTFAQLNAGSTPAIRGLVTGAGDDAGAVPPVFTPTELIGMEIGGPGVLPEDAEEDAGLRSNFQANGGLFTDADGAVLATQPTTVAAPGEVRTLMGGTTISGAMRPDGDGIPASDDMGMAPDGWAMKTLHRDWGDTAGDGDGGFETGAIVVKNLGEGTDYPFDRKLADKYVNTAAQNLFRLSILAGGGAPGVTTLATSVDINMSGTEATATQWAAMVFDSDSLVPAQDQDLVVDSGETFTGMYFGAPGQFRCLGVVADNNCGLMRNDDGDVVVVDQPFQTDGTTANGTGIQNGRWSFTPDPDAMITVPDQDWMAYGAWLTTPDNPVGNHRLGVFFDGMDPYEPIANSLTATDPAGLRGTATYSGGATGVYVDGTDSGLFTARAMLTAKFDADMDGVDDTGEYTVSGRIDNFRGTDGVYLGDDTQADPNDPTAGENDWVVELDTFDFGATTQDGATDMVIGATDTSGSADGVSWTGMWNGMFFGPGEDADGDAIAPSGVAGRFWAETADPLTTGDGAAGVGPATAVVGAFGATKDD